MLNPRFLVISLGNPLPKYSSLHSAGHFALKGLVNDLRQADFRQVKLGNAAACPVSQGPKYTLVQSPSLMNSSGVFVAAAWRHMCKQHNPASLGLVLVHDELEKALGSVNLVPWQRSARGHRGVKDAQARLRQSPLSPFARISVGIGRPEERDHSSVVDHVLRPITREERSIMEDDAPPEIIDKLIELEEFWAAEVQEGNDSPGLGWVSRMARSRS
ncbi:hypothetical protein CDD83_3432 [Cordyceps sp. RAO-2017]|nr:hypothetical protein CDD83_3432 [Cordyceps sp. RAO-2017]